MRRWLHVLDANDQLCGKCITKKVRLVQADEKVEVICVNGFPFMLGLYMSSRTTAGVVRATIQAAGDTWNCGHELGDSGMHVAQVAGALVRPLSACCLSRDHATTVELGGSPSHL
ncbi:hypothetical protein [Streptosporangium carneum]|uniref:Uncharacterized protein n=1 Tax=Streptosporangium carneum TaxID=47481 RepID=A0A9W6I325_9ACTN|nr:hypothetical protein [Streptosporangium carneum]GLK11132.1 hypothetical protein GCM10017600_45380 [Streptosporangium carneum]